MSKADVLADAMALVVKAALAPIEARLAASEQANADIRAQLADVGSWRERLAVVESKQAAAVLPAPVLGEVVPALSLPEIELALTKQVGPLSERLARLEERAPVPGPAGANGADGRDGKDGVDGVGFDDLVVDFDGERTLELKFHRGEVVKSFPITLPFLRYQGVFVEGKTYELGDVVTWGGSTWHANETTATKPGDGSKAWTLTVKRGRDGRDGKDAGTIPVVKV